ncbi:MAG: hypothetical protein JWO38_2152 [Gemmataceae bacterium]|nr:hypothetical protein [Gemmataceae bacterium]
MTKFGSLSVAAVTTALALLVYEAGSAPPSLEPGDGRLVGGEGVPPASR